MLIDHLPFASSEQPIRALDGGELWISVRRSGHAVAVGTTFNPNEPEANFCSLMHTKQGHHWFVLYFDGGAHAFRARAVSDEISEADAQDWLASVHQYRRDEGLAASWTWEQAFPGIGPIEARYRHLRLRPTAAVV